MELKIEYLPIKALKPYEKNTRKHQKKDVDNIARSIEKYGMCDAIGIWGEQNIIVEGHGRMMACKQLGMTEVPCVRLDHLTDEQRREYAIAHNATAELSEWDLDILPDELAELDLIDFDFDFGIEDEEEETEIVEDEAPEVDEDAEPITKLGDIWKLGRHRLMCGDSTDKATVELLMDGKKADMVFTDPPYGMKKEADGVLNDNLNYDDLLEFNKKWIPLTFANTKENGSWYCWGIDEPLMDIYSHILKPMAKKNEITFRNLITWDKGHGQGQNAEGFMMYPIADEKCLFVVRGIQCLTLNADQYWEEYEPIRKYLYDERIKCGWDIPTMKTIAGHSDKSRDHWTSKSQWNLPTKDVYEKFQAWARNNGVKAFEREYESLRREYESLRREYESLRAYFDNTHDNMNNVWHFDRTSASERELTGGHATPKPIALCSRAIKSSSRENESVLDMFGGSGSTLIACEQLDRTCYMMELDPKYCDVIIRRFENLTGEKAVLIND